MLTKYFWQWRLDSDLVPVMLVVVASFFAFQVLAHLVPGWLLAVLLAVVTLPILVRPSLARARWLLLGAVLFALPLAWFGLPFNAASELLLLQASVRPATIFSVSFLYVMLLASVACAAAWFLGFEARAP